MALPKLKRNGGFYGGGIKTLFDDLTIEFTGNMLGQILETYNQGYTLGEIAEYTKRDPDEVFLALLHLSRKDYEVKPLGTLFD